MPQSLEIVQTALRQIGVEAQEITSDASLRDDLSVDSTELIEIASVIERNTNIAVNDKHLKDIRTVAELVAYIDSRLQSS